MKMLKRILAVLAWSVLLLLALAGPDIIIGLPSFPCDDDE